MYGDIVPPKKNSFIKTRKAENEVRILKSEPSFNNRVYHTIDGKDKSSKTPLVLFLITVIIMSVVYYSVFNNKTFISFQSKTVILEVKDNIPMILSEKNSNASTTLSYNLIYVNDTKRNIFAPVQDVASTSAVVNNNADYFILNATTTSKSPAKKVVFINNTGSEMPLRENTRFDVGGETYYLQGKTSVKPTTDKDLSTTTSGYKVIGLKGTTAYDKFYAIDYISKTSQDEASTTVTNNSNIPNEEVLSLIPDNFIPLKKSLIYDTNTNQNALVVVDKKDFEKALYNNSKLIQEYVKVFSTIPDLIEYEININDYELAQDINGQPISFKNLTLEITPRVKKDKVASVFKGFSKETMKKIKNEIAKNMEMTVKYSPFWMSKVSDEDHISVEVK